MDAKVSRRAALGVIIAALAAGPFAIRSLRKKKPNISPDEAPYDRFRLYELAFLVDRYLYRRIYRKVPPIHH